MDYPDRGPRLSGCHHHCDHHCVCLQTQSQVSLNWVCAVQIWKHLCAEGCTWMCVSVCVSWLLTDICRMPRLTFPIFRTLLLPLLNTDKIHSKKYIQKSSDVTSYASFSLQVASLHNWEETIFSQWVRENCRFITLLGISGSILYQHRVWIWVWISTGKGRAWFTDCLHSTFITYLHSSLKNPLYTCLQAETCY